MADFGIYVGDVYLGDFYILGIAVSMHKGDFCILMEMFVSNF